MKLREIESDEIIRVGADQLQDRSVFTLTATAKAFRILSSSIYKHKVRAIIRELSCNAVDGHIAAGNRNPFDVHIPTILDPRFIVRDYGIGMSDEDIRTLYTTYFESTKSDSNDYNGALGLGSKSPFSYTDSFNVESYYNGMCRSYVMYVDGGFPYVDLVFEKETDEPNGIKVIVPVKPDDLSEWKYEAKRVYAVFGDIKPNIIGDSGVVIDYITRSEEKHEIFSAHHDFYVRGTLYAIMGDVAYPIEKSLYEHTFFELRIDKNNANFIEFEMGELDIMPSREELQNDKQTLKIFNDFFKKRSSSIKDMMLAEFNSNTTDREKYIWYESNSVLARKIIDSYPEFIFNRPYMKTDLMFDGYVFNLSSSSGKLQFSSSWQKTTTKRRNPIEFLNPVKQKDIHIIIHDTTQSLKKYVDGYCTYHNINPYTLMVVVYSDEKAAKLVTEFKKVGCYADNEITVLKTSDMKQYLSVVVNYTYTKRESIMCRVTKYSVTSDGEFDTTLNTQMPKEELEKIDGFAVRYSKGNYEFLDRSASMSSIYPIARYCNLHNIKEFYVMAPSALRYASKMKCLLTEISSGIKSYIENVSYEELPGLGKLDELMYIKLAKSADKKRYKTWINKVFCKTKVNPDMFTSADELISRLCKIHNDAYSNLKIIRNRLKEESKSYENIVFDVLREEYPVIAELLDTKAGSRYTSQEIPVSVLNAIIDTIDIDKVHNAVKMKTSKLKEKEQ